LLLLREKAPITQLFFSVGKHKPTLRFYEEGKWATGETTGEGPAK
jgi:hypothetical protein